MITRSTEDAYQFGIATGEWMERERILALLEAEWWMRPANKTRLIALIKGEQK